jgi:hypothetical protein
LRASWSASADFSSYPPPTPKSEPATAAVATTSAGVKSSGPSGSLIAAYSAGIFDGSVRASAMYLFTPARYSRSAARRESDSCSKPGGRAWV